MDDQKTDLSAKLDKQLETFGAFLLKLDLTLEQTTQINALMAETVVAHTMIEISKLMTEEDQKRWDKFMSTNPTDAQQLVILDEFCKRKTGKGIGHIQAKLMISLTNSFMEYFKNFDKNLEAIKELSDEQIKEILNKLASNDNESLF